MPTKWWGSVWHPRWGPHPLDAWSRCISIAGPLAQCAGKMQKAHRGKSLQPPTPCLANFGPQNIATTVGVKACPRCCSGGHYRDSTNNFSNGLSQLLQADAFNCFQFSFQWCDSGLHYGVLLTFWGHSLWLDVICFDLQHGHKVKSPHRMRTTEDLEPEIFKMRIWQFQSSLEDCSSPCSNGSKMGRKTQKIMLTQMWAHPQLVL